MTKPWRRTGAQLIWETLLDEGVRTVFGYPGGAILPAYDAMLDYPIRHILVRHEQGATHMADGYSRASGEVGVAVATSGPGATNMVTGIATAMLDSSPILCITGQVGSALIGTDAFQETDVTGVTLPITKHNYLVTDVDDVAPAIHEALYVARSGRPGPVLVDITKDAQQAFTEQRPRLGKVDLPGYRPEPKPPESELRRAAELINRASRPVILAGHGILISGAMGQVRELAECARIPIAMTLLGIGAIPANHSLNMGMMGMHGESWVNQAIQEADLLIALGMRFDDRVTGNLKTYAPNAAKIHIDIDPAEFNKNVRVDVGLAGDLAAVLAHLLPEVEARDRSEWLGTISGFKGDTSVRDIQDLPDMGRLYAAHVIHDIWRMTGGKAIVTTDVGQHQMWEAQYYPHNKPRSLITSGGLGTMGFAPPGGRGRQGGAPRRGGVGHRRRRRVPDDHVRTRHDRAGKAEAQHRHHQQRVPGHGAAVAGVLLRSPLRWHSDPEPGFRGPRPVLRPWRRDRPEPPGSRGRGRARPRRRTDRGPRVPGRKGGHRVPHGAGGRPAPGHDPAAGARCRRRSGGGRGTGDGRSFDRVVST